MFCLPLEKGRFLLKPKRIVEKNCLIPKCMYITIYMYIISNTPRKCEISAFMFDCFALFIQRWCVEYRSAIGSIVLVQTTTFLPDATIFNKRIKYQSQKVPTPTRIVFVFLKMEIIQIRLKSINTLHNVKKYFFSHLFCFLFAIVQFNSTVLAVFHRCIMYIVHSDIYEKKYFKKILAQTSRLCKL